ncbi:MAG: hypothetical protein ALECFALPRED_002108 [Alectoria fallacina]|uniref:Uncharacterized protein n=1 Tax=Alectoria fallacina TaxID=1903189 RepID=A0A8H3IKS0_9LECA|nr:MAG: hypothetical protein ALECFALPRED_002108 [Alectoria fallacina]
MPITIKPAPHGANVISRHQPAEDSRDLLNRACRKESGKCEELLQSSFDSNLNAAVRPSANGFVHGAIFAYNQHHHLQIRPEDVWFAIVSQLGFYINCHAEELRGMFVAHEGKKELTVTFETGDRYTVDFGVFAQRMSRLIEENVLDPELREWVMPAFSTTTEHDIVVAAILLMGVTQKYFDYKCRILCGLPSVTLLGQKKDWELIYSRLDKLDTFGAEPGQFCKLLRPVISRFVKSFDEPTSDDIVSFWQRIAHYYSMGSGPSFYSGWITAFCFWGQDGKTLYTLPQYGDSLEETSWEKARYPLLILDGVSYHRIESDEVPPGYSSVPVKVDDNGDEFDATMVAGSVGINCTSSGDELDGGLVELDTVSAETGWWMFEIKG